MAARNRTSPPAAFGLGVDLVEVSRIRRLAANPSFLKRVFTPGELAYSLKGKNRYERLAARFAVKEAVIKALDARGLSLKDIEVENTFSGRPLVKVKKHRSISLMVSISHTSRHALAAVVVVPKNT
ncbi:MAG: holo-[acyl-carrier-protein] synthase [Elusimicrobia bacterium RIFOXYA2_FULL_58_8]|nr:MAG: holo-[acyl-carrier-protein] synthase [Elusimicrobia bacterium RIFOXYA2_FULL_58_8]OGS13966.1 MAG: holo-[acyl-carrier-protein] synthase [Elusimicrobia bacterium RIFOXYA12_FULL_57_11]